MSDMYKDCAEVVILNKDCLRDYSVVNVYTDGFDSGDFWMCIDYRGEAGFMLNTYEEMTELWQTIKRVADKAKALHDKTFPQAMEKYDKEVAEVLS